MCLVMYDRVWFTLLTDRQLVSLVGHEVTGRLQPFVFHHTVVLNVTATALLLLFLQYFLVAFVQTLNNA